MVTTQSPVCRDQCLQVLANTKAKAKEVEGKLKEADERRGLRDPDPR